MVGPNTPCSLGKGVRWTRGGAGGTTNPDQREGGRHIGVVFRPRGLQNNFVTARLNSTVVFMIGD